MKRSLIVFLLFVLLCLITVFAQCNNGTSSWMRVYTTGRQPLTTYPEGTAIDPTGHLVGTDVVISPDGNIMVAAYVGDPGSPGSPAARAALGCIARDGSVAWSREYFPIEPPGSPEPEYWHFSLGGWPRLVALTHHNDFAFALSFSDILLLLDTEGIIIHSYRFPEIKHITGLLALPDGGLVMVGVGAPSLPARTPAVVYVLRLALPAGEEEPETLWARRIDGLKSNWQKPYPRPDVVRTVDEEGGSYFWVGAAGGFLGCLSEDGNLLNAWKLASKAGTKIHDDHGLVRNLQYGALATDQQGRLFFGGSLGVKSRFTSAISTFAFLTSLAPDPTSMSIIWARTLTENTGYGLGTVVHALQATPEGLFMAGRTSHWGQDEGHYNEAAYAARLQSNGSVDWVRLLGRKKYSEMKTEYSDDFGHAIVSTGDGGAVLVGGTSSFSHPEPWRQPVKEAMTEHPELLVVSLGSGGEVGNIRFGRYPELGLAPELGDRVRQVDVLTPEIIIEEANMSAEEITIAAETVSFGTREGGWEERFLKPVFKLALSEKGRILTSNLSIFVKEDEVGNPEIDSDGDGIVQEWENMAMEYINPYIELDEEEDWLIRRNAPHIVFNETDTKIVIPPVISDLAESEIEKYGGLGLITTATDHVANFVRVHPYPDFYYLPNFNYHSTNLPQYIIFRYVVTWSFDYGRFGIMGHEGDHERIFMAWKVIDDKTLRLEWVFTSSHRDPNAHHAVWNAWYSVCNKGDVALTNERTYHSEVMCSNLQFANDRLLVYASEDKHAIYPSCKVCEDVKLFIDVAGEDCGGGGRFRFDCYNVGEPPDFTDPHIYDLSLDKGKLGELEEENIGTELSLPNMLVNKLSSRYRIQIRTGNEELAGTDAKISIRLFGSGGTSPWYEIYSEPRPPSAITIERLGTFEKGDTDNIYINSLDLGEVYQIQIQHDNSGLGPGWYISEIWVEDLETN
ncbi:MAG: hypothetical protein JXN64_01795, partial [Spirochaetes bacterium]|nr:hypothetical protein [Spirochaetota bacterium]